MQISRSRAFRSLLFCGAVLGCCWAQQQRAFVGTARPSIRQRPCRSRCAGHVWERGATTRAHAAVDALVGVNEERSQEWWRWCITLTVLVVVFYTALDCVLDPGMEYPWGPFSVALPTIFLVAPAGALQACAKLPSRPCSLEEAKTKQNVFAVFVGDSLTHGSLSANFLEVLATRHSGQGEFVNVGMNMRPSVELLDGRLLEDAAAAMPRNGVVVLIGTNDIIRYTALPGFARAQVSEWLSGYVANMKEIVRRLKSCGVIVTLTSPPLVGEDPNNEQGQLGKIMASEVRQLAAEAGCRYVPLYEATVDHINAAAASGSLAPRSRGYSPESFVLMCTLPWRIYGARTPLAQIQDEQQLQLTLDLVHFGPRFAHMAANLFADSFSLAPQKSSQA